MKSSINKDCLVVTVAGAEDATIKPCVGRLRQTSCDAVCFSVDGNEFSLSHQDQIMLSLVLMLCGADPAAWCCSFASGSLSLHCSAHSCSATGSDGYLSNNILTASCCW
eukprot:GHUV01027453.1.p1 GENE.GHUV01027453.1~~GHUV01027453.1.p1  ORF type:complete len:109 (-),score=18.70 GHUV01027453.1:141-467(-)